MIWALGLLLSLLGDMAVAAPAPKAKGAVVPIYDGASTNPVLLLKVSNLRPDLGQFGFFKCALLPLLVAEDVSFDFLQPEALTNALHGAQAWLLPRMAGRTLELRRVRFGFPGEKASRLEAATVRPQTDGTWLLGEGAVLRQGGQTLRLGEARLHVAGPQAGLIEERPATSRRHRLFSPSLSSNQSTPQTPQTP